MRSTPRMLRLSVPNALAAIEPARLKVLDFFGEDRLGDRARYRVELILEETLMNRLMHAFPAGSHRATDVTVTDAPDGLELCFEDDGVPFDPRDVAPPTPAAVGAGATPGGWGLLLTRAAASAWDYRRADGRNRFTVRVSRS